MLDGTRPWHTELLPILDESETLAIESGDLLAQRDVHNFRLWIAAMLGDVGVAVDLPEQAGHRFQELITVDKAQALPAAAAKV